MIEPVLRSRIKQRGRFVRKWINPIDGAVGELLSLINGYNYLGGNPVNRVDPSGMCPERRQIEDDPSRRTTENYYDAIEIEQCYQMRSELRSWGVNVVWDTTAIDPYWARQNCLPEQVAEACNPEGGQRWTTNEMRAAFNAFKIFEGAHQNLGMGSVYQWPLANTVTYRKRDYVGTSNADLAALGKHEYTTRTITMSARNWGEFENTAYRLNQQIRAWLVLHEFSHIFVKDRTPPNDNFENYATVTLPSRILDKFGMVVPTGYATFSDQERAIEVVTATLWNNGFSAVTGFKSGAGGRTAQIGGTAQDRYNGQAFNLTNVRDVVDQGETLEQWIIANVILRNPQ